MTKRADQFAITLAQLNPTVGDIDGNAVRVAELAAQFAHGGARALRI